MKEQILVIEDDESFRKTLINFLRKEGYKTSGAKDGFQAIEMVKKDSYALIISDVKMPGMDGIEVISKILKATHKKIKTILMTGYADPEAPRRATQIGVNEYIYKPFKMALFLQSISRLIQDYRLETGMN